MPNPETGGYVPPQDQGSTTPENRDELSSTASSESLGIEKLPDEEKERRKEIRRRLIATFSEVLRPLGFRRESSTWLRDLGGIVQLVNLQRSQYSLAYYLNVGIFRKPYSAHREYNRKTGEYSSVRVEKPWIGDCHFNDRIGRIAGASGADIRQVESELDFESTKSLTDAERRIASIRDILTAHLVPFLESTNSLDTIQQQAEQGPYRDLLGDWKRGVAWSRGEEI